MREVGLTEDERRRLDQLATELSGQDPQLARMLSGRQPALSRLRLLVRILLLAAAVLLVIGVATTQTLLVAMGCLAMIGAAMLLLTLRR